MDILASVGVTLLGILSLAYIISYVSIPVIKRAAEIRNLFDHPDDYRKIHNEAIPTLGGVDIFMAFLLSYSVSPWSDLFEGYSYFVGALLILFFIGLKDDLVTLSAWKKIAAQLLAAGLVIFGSGIFISDFNGVMGAVHIPMWAGIPLSFFTIIVVINAMNLIDGIDGLAAGIGTMASILFGTGFLMVGDLPMAGFSFALAGALFGFLRYNFSPASIFMGDTGSMLIGFLLSVQAIQFLSLSNYPEFYSVFTNAAPLLVVSIMAFPLYDTLRVVFKRVRRGKSMFTPGLDHVHHELLRMGLSHRGIALLLYGQSLLIVVLAGFLSQLNLDINLQIAAVIASCMIFYPTNGFKRRMVTKLFDAEWRSYQARQWGIDIDPRRAERRTNGIVYRSPLRSLNPREREHFEKEERRREEIEEIAV